MYVNYGAIGMVIGHEMSHGFDIIGKQFDSTGVLRNWWSPTSEAAYLDRTRCYVLHYGRQTVSFGTNGSLAVNAVQTLGENLSDHGGLKLAKAAYDIWRRKQKYAGIVAEETPLRLDGVVNHLGAPFTVDQLFYITYAQNWCEKYQPEILHFMLDNDAHLPGEARVRGTVALDDGFQKAMRCNKGDEMVADNQCDIW